MAVEWDRAAEPEEEEEEARVARKVPAVRGLDAWTDSRAHAYVPNAGKGSHTSEVSRVLKRNVPSAGSSWSGNDSQGRKQMKVVFTTQGKDLNAPMDSRFGRAPKFLVYEVEKKTFEVVDNLQNMNASQGAGIQSAETVARFGADAVVTGHCGPKAFRVLSAAGIRIFNTNAATVAEALEQYLAGRLSGARAADVEGHWA